MRVSGPPQPPNGGSPLKSKYVMTPKEEERMSEAGRVGEWGGDAI